MGVSEFFGFTINPTELIQGSDNLHHLENPFNQEEIDSVIRNLPNFKSPGPDGFNNEFTKASWETIKQDFYDLCRGFYENNCCLQSINNSYITLIHKIENPQYVNEYRPISLMNTSVKLLTKILAFKLQRSITSLVHKNSTSL